MSIELICACIIGVAVFVILVFAFVAAIRHGKQQVRY